MSSIAKSSSSTSPGSNVSSSISKVPSLVKTRVLFGWISPEELGQQFSGTLGNPEEYKALLEKHTSMMNAVKSRSKYSPESPIINGSKKWTTLSELAKRPELQSMFNGMDWELAVVDLNKIIAFQKSVKIHGLNERVAYATTNEKSLLDLCVPLDDPELPSVHYVDLDGKAFTISSPNPNFRILDARIEDVDKSAAPGMPPFKTKAISMLVGTVPSYLHVVEFEGRYYLRDGYHRAVGLLRANINEVPCVLARVQDSKLIAPIGNHLSPDCFMGDQPPLLADFLNDDVSDEGLTSESLKIIRIRGEEFAVSA